MNPSNAVIHISVRDLVERFVRVGDLTSGVFIPDRATAAIALHQRIQQSRPEVYEPEVTISHVCESGPWTIHISGRIDGIFRYPGCNIGKDQDLAPGFFCQLVDNSRLSLSFFKYSEVKAGVFFLQVL